MNQNIYRRLNRITIAAPAVLFAALIIAAYPTRLRAEVVLWTGGSATSSDWSDPANWLAGNAPMNGDDVVFGLNFQTTNFNNFFSLNINTLQFSAPAPAFTIHIIKTSALTISGAGVINNSANIETLINDTSSGDGPQVAGTTIFQNNATADDLHIINQGGNFFVDGWGETVFEGTSNAGTAVITNEGPFGTGWGGLTFFRENSNAANATITNSGGVSSNNVFGRSATEFSGSASASGATIINQAGQFGGATYFFGNSTADSATISNNGAAAFGDEGGSTHFISGPFEIATAANATITNHGGAANNAVGGQARFAGVASAGSAMINNNGGTVGSFTGAALGGRTLFIGSSTASSATINSNGGTALFAGGGVTEFSDMSTASSATINNNAGTGGFAGGGVTEFTEMSMADSATITNNGATAANLAFGGETRFNDSSSANEATLIANGGTNGGAGGRIFFNGDSTGNHVRVEVFGNGLMDISGHNAPGLTVGSIAGSGNIFLGANRLVVGSNNINTNFSGVIQNGGLSGGSAGSLQKVGLGTLTLSGTNTYTGQTTVSVGALLVNGSITSAVTVNGGTLGGSGTTGAVTVNDDGTLAPGNSPGILNAQGDLALMMGSTYLVELNGTAVGTQYDQTNVTGTVSLDDGTLSLSVGFTPTLGDMFTIVNNDLSDPVTGTFDGFSEGAIVTADGQSFAISYQGGNGNDIVLEAVPEPGTWALLSAGVALLLVFRRWSKSLAPSLKSECASSSTKKTTKPIATALSAAILSLLSSALPALAGSATWLPNPPDGNWNNPSNWTAGGPPNGAMETATFAISSQLSISLSAYTEVNAIVFNAGASGYTITVGPALGLGLSGAGISNGSGMLQQFSTLVDSAGGWGNIVFLNTATAGSMTQFTNSGALISMGAIGGLTQFFNTSNAGTGSFTSNGGAANGALGGTTDFIDDSSASGATFTNRGGAVGFALGGETRFFGTSSADSGTFTNEAGTVNGGRGGRTEFHGESSAANGIFTNNGATVFGADGGVTQFHDDATAEAGVFTTHGGSASGAGGGLVEFNNNSNAGTGTFINNGSTSSGALGGVTEFLDSSSAESATFTNNAGTTAGAIGGGGGTNFLNTSSAGSGIFTNNGSNTSGAVGGFTNFFTSSSAESGTFTNNGATVSGGEGGETRFFNSSRAESATLIANGGTNGGRGGGIRFEEDSVGDTARVQLFGNGYMEIGAHTAPGVAIGSIEGSGNVFLGARQLSVGSNNMTTSFSGVIQDGSSHDPGDGVGGNLTKTGTGTLILSGPNTYTGSTTVNQGTLLVNGSITSAVTVNGGTLGGSGSTGAVTVNNGGTLAPGNSAGILNVQGDLALAMGATYLVELNGAAVGTGYDQTNVMGLVSLGNATLSLSLGFTPVFGTEFIIINNDLSEAIAGMFDGLSEGATFIDDGQTFTISYQGGDGNDVVLEAVPEPGTWVLFAAGLTLLAGGQRWIKDFPESSRLDD